MTWGGAGCRGAERGTRRGGPWGRSRRLRGHPGHASLRVPTSPRGAGTSPARGAPQRSFCPVPPPLPPTAALCPGVPAQETAPCVVTVPPHGASAVPGAADSGTRGDGGARCRPALGPGAARCRWRGGHRRTARLRRRDGPAAPPPPSFLPRGAGPGAAARRSPVPGRARCGAAGGKCVTGARGSPRESHGGGGGAACGPVRSRGRWRAGGGGGGGRTAALPGGTARLGPVRCGAARLGSEMAAPDTGSTGQCRRSGVRAAGIAGERSCGDAERRRDPHRECGGGVPPSREGAVPRSRRRTGSGAAPGGPDGGTGHRSALTAARGGAGQRVGRAGHRHRPLLSTGTRRQPHRAVLSTDTGQRDVLTAAPSGIGQRHRARGALTAARRSAERQHRDALTALRKRGDPGRTPARRRGRSGTDSSVCGPGGTGGVPQRHRARWGGGGAAPPPPPSPPPGTWPPPRRCHVRSLFSPQPRPAPAHWSRPLVTSPPPPLLVTSHAEAGTPRSARSLRRGGGAANGGGGGGATREGRGRGRPRAGGARGAAA